MARENIYILQDAPPWTEAAAVLGYVWCVRNGAIIAGSQTVASAIPVPQTGSIIQDVADFLGAWFLDATGDAAAGTPIVDPISTFDDGWGVAGLLLEGPGGQVPGVYLWAGEGYDFGTLNLPLQSGVDDYRDWFVKFTAETVAADAVPAWPIIANYIAAQGANPVLHIAELKSIE
jgi:hypothetical protein